MKFAAPGSMILTLAVALAAVADEQPQGNAQQVEAQVMQQMRSLEHQLGQQEQILQKKMQRAASLRQQALKDNNGEMLKQAEAIEREAVADYQQQIERFEQYSKRLTEATTEQARSQAATYNRQAPQAGPQAPAQQRPPQSRYRSMLERRGQQPAADQRSLEPIPQKEEEEQPESRGWFRPLRRWFSN